MQAPEPPKLVLIGESNPYGADPAFALYHLPRGATGDRLRRIVLGVTPDEYLHHDRLNLLTASRWSIVAARRETFNVYDAYPGRVLVLLGGKVRDAFGHGKDRDGPAAPWFSVIRASDGGAVVILPHPSGLCREWQKPGAVISARAALREAAPGVVLGSLR